MNFLLASSSVYRAELLNKIILDFDTCSPNIDETPLQGESAINVSARLSVLKAIEAAKSYTQRTIIASDQTAEIVSKQTRYKNKQSIRSHSSNLLGKPHTKEKAIEQLTNLSGNIAMFYTGLCLLTPYSFLSNEQQNSLNTLPLLTQSDVNKTLAADYRSLNQEGLDINLPCEFNIKISNDDKSEIKYFCQLEVDIYKVKFRPLRPNTVTQYINKENPLDCAGSFKSEGLGIALFESMRGDDPNSLVGLPLIKLCSCLNKIGYTVV